MPDEFDDLMAGGDGIPSATLDDAHPTVKGRITAKAVTDARVYGTNEVKTWPSGDPIKQIVITLATDERDPRVPDDDGKRKVYAEQDSRPGSKMAAIREAMRAAGAKTIEVGGILAIAYTGPDPESTAQIKRKLYRAQYQPPAAAAADDLLGTPAQARPVDPII